MRSKDSKAFQVDTVLVNFHPAEEQNHGCISTKVSLTIPRLTLLHCETYHKALCRLHT
jgi:hypothetical protein